MKIIKLEKEIENLNYIQIKISCDGRDIGSKNQVMIGCSLLNSLNDNNQSPRKLFPLIIYEGHEKIGKLNKIKKIF